MRRVPWFLLLIMAWPRFAAAEAGTSRPNEEPRAASGEGVAAKQHFEAALDHYREGHYRSAIAELEASLNLDPASKDLLFNLALVHEKLGELNQAIVALERYTEIETDPRELERAHQWIQRMKGAREELGPPVVPARVPMPPPPPAAVPVEPSSNRGWMIATASIAVAAVTVGTIFGVRALVLRPGPNPSTSPGTSVEDLRNAQAEAETSALVADVAFAIGIVSSGATAVLWLRDDANACPRPSVGKAPLGVTITGAF